MICNKCGENISEEQSFCSKCGNKVSMSKERRVKNSDLSIISAVAGIANSVFFALILLLVDKNVISDDFTGIMLLCVSAVIFIATLTMVIIDLRKGNRKKQLSIFSIGIQALVLIIGLKLFI
jgi:predicted nucleic acid-binding Zn ribbon protein